jgi:hypothetical protein
MKFKWTDDVRIGNKTNYTVTYVLDDHTGPADPEQQLGVTSEKEIIFVADKDMIGDDLTIKVTDDCGTEKTVTVPVPDLQLDVAAIGLTFKKFTYQTFTIPGSSFPVNQGYILEMDYNKNLGLYEYIEIYKNGTRLTRTENTLTPGYGGMYQSGDVIRVVMKSPCITTPAEFTETVP